MTCPFCAQQNISSALVCASCSRDIAVPASLIAERDDLVSMRDAVREELSGARRELDQLMRARQNRSI